MNSIMMRLFMVLHLLILFPVFSYGKGMNYSLPGAEILVGRKDSVTVAEMLLRIRKIRDELERRHKEVQMHNLPQKIRVREEGIYREVREILNKVEGDLNRGQVESALKRIEGLRFEQVPNEKRRHRLFWRRKKKEKKKIRLSQEVVEVKKEEYVVPERRIKKIEMRPEFRKKIKKGKDGSSRMDVINGLELAYNGSIDMLRYIISSPDTSVYLSESPEIQFSERIKRLADSLKTPYRIFEYVLNRIDYEPYYGSLKGAEETLLEGKGNDMDISSLLITLLRYRGYKARYVCGEVIVPVEWMMENVGIRDPYVLGNLLATNHIPVSLLMANGKPYGYKLKWVWVEAYIPYEGSKVYRGVFPEEGPGNARWMWVDIDCALSEYRETSSKDLSEVVSFDAEGLISMFEGSGVYDSLGGLSGLDTTIVGEEWRDYRDRFRGYLQDSLENPVIRNVCGWREHVDFHPGYIPGKVPYKVQKILGKWAEVPDSLRHKVRIVVSYWPLYLAEEMDLFEIDYMVPTCELTDKRITISYRPAREEDYQTINEYGGLYNVPPYLIHLFMQLKVDGEIRGDHLIDEITMGLKENVGIWFYTPWSGDEPEEKVENRIVAGGHYAVVFDLQHMPEEIVKESGEKVSYAVEELSRYEDDYIGEQLRNVGLTYFYQMDRGEEMLGRAMGVVITREPAECFVSFNLDVSYLGWIPWKITGSKVIIDLDRNIEGPFPVDGDTSKIRGYFMGSGIMSSILEEAVLEELYRIPSLSAVQILREANEVGIPIYLINQDNIDNVSLSIPYDAMEEIRGYVELGYEAIVPQREITIMDWHGVGYVIRDPETYAGMYMINGAYGGGTFKEKIEEFLEQFLTPSSDIWTDLEGSTVPVLDAITETYGFFDDPNVNLLMQDNICAYIMSLGPLFLMSMFPSLPGFLCTLEWVSKMYVEFLNVGVINLDFRRTSYFRSLGRRRVKALVSRLLGEPLRGVLLQFRTTNMNSSIEPLEVETDSNGYAVAVFDGMSLSPGDTTSIIVRGEIRGKERHTVGGLYVRDNSNIRIKDVLEGRAVYVYDEGVESRSEDTVKEWGNRKFDYVQELLNQVVSRKFFLYDKDGNSVDYEFLEEDGVYGSHTEGAIEVLRSSFEWIGWRWSDVIIKLREQYENNFSYKEWRDKVVDKGLLVGDRYIYHPRRVVLEDTTNIARDGLLEIYQNYVEVFIDSLPCPHFLDRYKYRGKQIFVNVDFRRKSTNFDTFNLLLIVFKRCLVI